MTSSNSLIALSDPSLSGAAGAITYWSGTSGVRVSELDAALKARGLDLAPESPSPEVRVRRAVEAALPKGHFVRPSPAGGRSVVREIKDGKRLRHVELMRAAWAIVDGKGQLQTEVFENESQADVDLAEATAQEVRERFVEDADLLTSEDLLVWLGQRVVRTCEAVSLRKMGGVYFVPRHYVSLWQQIRDAVHEVGHGARISQIPAMDGADAAMAVLDALQAEAQQRVEEIEREIEGGELQRRALDSRTERLEALIEKLEGYARELDLDVMQAIATCNQAKANVVVAINALSKDEKAAEA